MAAFIPAMKIGLRGAWRAMRQLFHEVTGSAFAVFAIFGFEAAWRGHQAGQNGWILAIPLSYAAMMSFFSLVSFRDSRRVR